MTTKRESAQTRKADAAELIRALMDGPKTSEELGEVVHMTGRAVLSWLRAYREAGIVYIADRLPGQCFVYALQTKPFANPDVPRKDMRVQRRASRDSYAQRGMRSEA